MQTLSYGYYQPQPGDKGTPVFDALNANIQRVNDHTHDGVNGSLIPASNIASSQLAILSSGWAPYTNGPTGHLRQLVSMVPGYVFEKSNIGFHTADGAVVYPTVERVSSTSYYIYSIDPNLNLVAIYGG